MSALPKSIRNYEKKNNWNVRRLVDESFVPLANRTSILYCRLSDFMNGSTFDEFINCILERLSGLFLYWLVYENISFCKRNLFAKKFLLPKILKYQNFEKSISHLTSNTFGSTRQKNVGTYIFFQFTGETFSLL